MSGLPIIYFWSSNGQLMQTVALRVDDLLMKHVDCGRIGNDTAVFGRKEEKKLPAIEWAS